MTTRSEKNIKRNIAKLQKILKNLPIVASKSQKLHEAKVKIRSAINSLEQSLDAV